jgi:hypothetical protein
MILAKKKLSSKMLLQGTFEENNLAQNTSKGFHNSEWHCISSTQQ